MYKFTQEDNLCNFAVQNTKKNLTKYCTIREKKTSLHFLKPFKKICCHKKEEGYTRLWDFVIIIGEVFLLEGNPPTIVWI